MLNKLVSINSVIVDLCDELGINHTKNKARFINWATKAEKAIGSARQYVQKIVVLTIKNCSVDLPTDAAFVDLALLGDYGCDCGNLFERLRLGTASITAGDVNSTSFLIVDLPYQYTTESGSYSISPITASIQDGKIVLSQNCDGQKITIQYKGMVTDSEGLPMVMENHLEAITEYCLWKYKRSHARSGLDIGAYRDHKNEWERLAASARADDSIPTDSEQKLISDMLNNPLAGRSL